MPDDWRKQLVDRYPKLFSRTVDGKTVYSGYPCVGDGWRELVEKAIARVVAALKDAPSGQVMIVQIKEKFGTIRIYYDWHDIPDAVAVNIAEATSLAEARSACTCETCGRKGRMFESNGWYATRCDEHAASDAALVGGEDTFVKYAVVDGKWKIIARRRYDRERDAFVDLPIETGDSVPRSPRPP